MYRHHRCCRRYLFGVDGLKWKPLCVRLFRSLSLCRCVCIFFPNNFSFIFRTAPGQKTHKSHTFCVCISFYRLRGHSIANDHVWYCLILVCEQKQKRDSAQLTLVCFGVLNVRASSLRAPWHFHLNKFYIKKFFV